MKIEKKPANNQTLTNYCTPSAGKIQIWNKECIFETRKTSLQTSNPSSSPKGSLRTAAWCCVKKRKKKSTICCSPSSKTKKQKKPKKINHKKKVVQSCRGWKKSAQLLSVVLEFSWPITLTNTTMGVDSLMSCLQTTIMLQLILEVTHRQQISGFLFCIFFFQLLYLWLLCTIIINSIYYIT